MTNGKTPRPTAEPSMPDSLNHNISNDSGNFNTSSQLNAAATPLYNVRGIRILPTRNGRALWSALKTCVSRFRRNGLILSREHKRDEKKIIILTLKKNAKKLYGYWNQYINGYIPPDEDETGKQYYKES